MTYPTQPQNDVPLADVVVDEPGALRKTQRTVAIVLSVIVVGLCLTLAIMLLGRPKPLKPSALGPHFTTVTTANTPYGNCNQTSGANETDGTEQIPNEIGTYLNGQHPQVSGTEVRNGATVYWMCWWIDEQAMSSLFVTSLPSGDYELDPAKQQTSQSAYYKRTSATVTPAYVGINVTGAIVLLQLGTVYNTGDLSDRNPGLVEIEWQDN